MALLGPCLLLRGTSELLNSFVSFAILEHAGCKHSFARPELLNRQELCLQSPHQLLLNIQSHQ
eukprot:2548943-Amphidinium_carterae.1